MTAPIQYSAEQIAAAVLVNNLTVAAMTLRQHGSQVDLPTLKHRHAPQELTGEAVAVLLQKEGLKARLSKVKHAQLSKLKLPIAVESRDGRLFFVNAVREDGSTVVQRPGQQPQAIARSAFDGIWTGKVLIATKPAKTLKQEISFGLGWFFEAMGRYKNLLGEIVLASFFVQLFGLTIPIFFHIVIDKVLVHQGLTTLNVLFIGLVGLTLFEAVLSYLRTYLFAHTTSRVDARLGANLYDHLMHLPMSFFDSRPVGQTAARVRELDRVREFITGNGLTALLDVLFAGLFFLVMYLFSPLLTAIVAASIPVYVLITLALTPVLKRRMEAQFQHGAENQAFLVESLSNAETVKGLGVEPRFQQRWEENLSAFVTSNFHSTAWAAAGAQSVQLVGRIVTACILFMGAKLVMSGDLSVGQLVAFNMLAAQVAQPILRLAKLSQDFQQFRLSIRRLGDILNLKTERASARGSARSAMKGAVRFENVRFAYGESQAPVLNELSLNVDAGEAVGIIGGSGSGKSTIARLIQGFASPQGGELMIDGQPISQMPLDWLRRQISVVGQDSALFAMSVRENIAIADPSFSLERVIKAAKLAGAHGFITRLPQGYDTPLDERGANLSSGQRQRLALARALITDPRILILDEATSALDQASEREVQANMARVAKGRTVIVIAHRASSLAVASRVYEMRNGKLELRPTKTPSQSTPVAKTLEAVS